MKAKEHNMSVFEATVCSQILNQGNMKIPTKSSANITAWATFLIGILSFILCGVTANGRHLMTNGSLTGIVLVVLVCLVFIFLSFLLIVIHRQPQSCSYVAFKVPLVPFIPTLSILLNMYLMVSMDASTWAKFCVWMLIGFAIYGGYGIRNSKAASDNTTIEKETDLKTDVLAECDTKPITEFISLETKV